MKIRFLASTLLVITLSLPLLLSAQSVKKIKDNWQNLDLKTDSVFGMSTEKAYKELLAGKKHVPVIVGIIDDGFDVNHEDLKAVIWTNQKETADNNKDDDRNGYADDVHGWNFIGGPKGDIEYETEEYVRLVRRDRAKYDKADSTKLSPAELVKYRDYRRMKAKIAFELKDKLSYVNWRDSVNKGMDTLLMDLKTNNPTPQDLKTYKPKNDFQKQTVRYYIAKFKGGNFMDFVKKDLDASMASDSAYIAPFLKYKLNIDYDPRYMVGDNVNDDNEHFYGNNHVGAPDADHGTHVSGIIGAVRDNDLGIKGVANDVQIMAIRAIPQGDERDKDVANAIRYAVNNGARVINMSFGKDDSANKKIVDDAVKYAVSKDVLLVHAAGNDNSNTEKVKFYPNRKYIGGSEASSWIEVGAAGRFNDSTLKASFSNYGKTTVDVFAPGVSIKSSIVGSKYDVYSGTSMASPMVAGLAALIRSYYPKLTAVQVKEIILRSVVKVDHDVIIYGDKTTKVPFADLSISGGIVNAYNALKLAATY